MNRTSMNCTHNLMNAANTAVVRILSGILIALAAILVLSIRIIGLVRVILAILANTTDRRFADSRRRLLTA